jgi:hypothetical protein
MLRYDLFPILYPNLLSVAGVWQGFDGWLLQNIQDRRSGVAGWLKSQVGCVAWYLLGHYYVQPLWDKVKEGLNDGSNARL